MHSDSSPVVPHLKQLVLVGGGHSQLQVLMSLAMAPIPGLRTVLISKDTMTGYSGMLPGYIAGHYSFDETHIDLRRLCAWAGVMFIEDRVVGLDTSTRRVVTSHHGDIHYDWLSINIGSTPNRSQISGRTDRLIPVKPIDIFLQHLDRIEHHVTEDGQPLRLGVIGAGAAGVEVLLALKQRLAHGLEQGHEVAEQGFEFHLFNSADTILPTHNVRVQRYFRQHLSGEGVVVHDDFEVVALEQEDVISRSGEHVAVDEVILTTSAAPQGWPGRAGLQVDDRGFIAVNEFLQSCSHPEIFATGDIATFMPSPSEKAGVFAVRQGRPLAENLRRSVANRPLKPYRAQKKWLALLACGDRYAVASRGHFFARGRWVWRWKDHIDRQFMRMFQQLPDMPPPKLPPLSEGLLTDNETLVKNLGMRCAGCGAKVGGDVLQVVLDSLHQGLNGAPAEEIVHRDDAAIIEVPQGQLLLQSLDYFTALVDDPWELGRIAANHALGDIYAMGGKPHSALALASLPHGNEQLVAETLRMMLEGSISMFADAAVALTGGHTSEAAELSLGFSVTGFVSPEKVLHKSGMRPGDVLLMTQAIGTGVLFAGHQQARAKGIWLEQAITNMTRSYRHAAEILLRHGATACTDVTGFGLMGHLLEMLRPGKQCLRLDIAAIPLLPGALALSKEGIRSSLFPANSKARHVIDNLDRAHRHPAFELLFDPQTAGGLMAFVPPGNAEACLQQLQQFYPDAVQIGEVTKSDGEGPAVTLVNC